MMTLKHAEPTGHEVVFQVTRVTYHPYTHSEARTSDEANPAQVFYELLDGSGYFINSGTVYVMNDNGKTVSVYRLDQNSAAPRAVTSGEGRDPRVAA